MNQVKVKFGGIQMAIIGLTLITALVHLILGIGMLSEPLGILFLFNFVGYVALVTGLYFVPQLSNRRSQIRYALMAFAAITVIAWIPAGTKDALAYFDKLVEVVLVVLLYLESRA